METSIKQFSIADISKRANISAEEANTFLDLIKCSMEPLSMRFDVIEGGAMNCYAVERRGIGVLKTKHGKFWQYDFVIDDQWQKYSVIVKAGLDQDRLMPVFKQTEHLVLRIDSGCETGQIFGDLTCECHEQLHLALKTIEEVGEGMIINIPRQDGRGMGLSFKLATLWLQDVLGVNTVESATLLALDGVIDIRTYSGVIAILKFFGISKACRISLATNNPKKAGVFAENGYTVVGYTPIVIEPNEHTEIHLKAKQEHLGHRGLVKKGKG